MMDKKHTSGTITLKTAAAASLFQHEIKGQMSDGRWENTRPYDHWRWWSNLNVVAGDVNVVTSDQFYLCRKAGYGLNALVKYVGDRMAAVIRLSRAVGRVLTEVEASAAAYMPETPEAWMSSHITGQWKYDFIAKYMSTITPDVAEAYYYTVAPVTMGEVRRELKNITEAIHSVKRRI